MTTWLTSDTHFYHKNVIEYCKRPFKDVDHMNEMLIQNWNECVQPEDTIIVLGDFVFGGSTKIKYILSRLVGRKILIMGNHDWKYNALRWVEFGFEQALSEARGFSSPETSRVNYHLSHFPYKGQQVDGRDLPYPVDDGKSILLHGHVHHHWKKNGRMVNVGCDVWDYKPVSMEQITELVKTI